MASATLLDIAKLTGNDKLVGLIEENQSAAPEVMRFPMRTIAGTSFKTGFRTSLPTTGFRTANGGQTPSKSGFSQKLVECFIFGGIIEVDKAVALAHEDGPAAYEMIEASGVAESALRELGSQIWYGTSNESLGFPGAKAFTPFGGTTAVTGDALTVNATGTTATTASSVYAVKFGEKYAQLIGGRGNALTLSDFMDQVLADADGKKYAGRVADMTGWIGLSLQSEHSVRRICNLTADSGKGLTDTLLASLIATFPVGVIPDAIFASRRSISQLQTARTPLTYSKGEQAKMADYPTEYMGIPIIATDSILNTDAIES